MKITFEDWELGRITIDGTYYKIPEGLNEPRIINWNQIEQQIQTKIKITQEQIFKEICSEVFQNISKDFETRFQNSKFKLLLIKKELNKLKEVLFENTEPNARNIDYSWGEIEPFDLLFTDIIEGIRRYFNEFYIDGFIRSYNFINSPKSPYFLIYDEYYIPEVQGEVLSMLYYYLLELENGSLIQFNSNFWDSKTFQLFKYLAEKFVHETTITKYNLIYHFLKTINEKDFTNYSFRMSTNDYYDFVKNNINEEFHSKTKGKPTMNRPENNENELLFKPLYLLKKEFENLYEKQLLELN